MTFIFSIFRKLWRYLIHFYERNKLDILPARHDLKTYNTKKGFYDIKAAFNVALLSIPQGMAYAAIADLPIINGIVCSCIAAFIAPLFASSQHTILGPTNATSFMLFSYFAASGIERDAVLLMIPMLVFMVGMFSVIGSYLKLADMIQYVSRSVLVGYITGAAVLIILNQLKHLLGVAPDLSAALVEIQGTKTFFTIATELSKLFQIYEWQPLLLGLITLICYLILNKKLPTLPNFAICLTISSILAAIIKIVPADVLDAQGKPEYFFAAFDSSELAIQLPNFSYFPELVGVAFAIMFLASLENTVMSKQLASQTGDRSDVNQDMLSVGMANVAASFMAPMAASGSLTRSALNFSSGAQTRFASIFTAIICTVGLIILLNFDIVSHIPKATLAALVIGIALTLIKWKNIRICLRSTHDDAVVIIVTFAATLLTRLDYAIFIGVATSITLFLRKASRPHLVEYEMGDDGDLRELGEKRKRPNPAISIVHVEGDLFFGAAELFRTQVQRTAADENLKVIILRLKNARHLDATSVMAMQDLIKFMRQQGRHVLVSGASREVYKVLKLSGVLETVQEGCDRKEGQTNLFLFSPSNPNLSTRDALLRAQELLGTKKADIKIFYDPSHEKKN